MDWFGVFLLALGISLLWSTFTSMLKGKTGFIMSAIWVVVGGYLALSGYNRVIASGPVFA